jgi:hypothetical protein
MLIEVDRLIPTGHSLYTSAPVQTASASRIGIIREFFGIWHRSIAEAVLIERTLISKWICAIINIAPERAKRVHQFKL